MISKEVCEVSKNKTSVLKVLNGEYPRENVSKMNTYYLEQFVSRLVRCTVEILGAKSLSENIPERPQWLAKEITQNQADNVGGTLNKNRMTLQQLVLKFAEFFRNCPAKETWLVEYKKFWMSDENHKMQNGRGVKRKRKTSDNYVRAKRKRKTLSVKNILDPIPKIFEPVVKLHDILKPLPPPSPPASEVYSQKENYMSYFGLKAKENGTGASASVLLPRMNSAHNAIRLHTNPTVPWSSDEGRILLGKEKSLSEDLKLRRLERLEWYLNKPALQQPDKRNYTVTFIPKKNNNLHHFTFPKRRYHQTNEAVHKNSALLKMCRPLRVVVERNDLVKLRKRCSREVKVVLPRLTTEQLSSLRRKLTVVVSVQEQRKVINA